jgi:hypothetical protein
MLEEVLRCIGVDLFICDSTPDKAEAFDTAHFTAHRRATFWRRSLFFVDYRSPDPSLDFHVSG